MEKYISLDNNNYFYFSDYNIIINSELADRFDKYSQYFPKVNVKNISISENSIKREIKNNLKQITFELTQDCNLNCKYCIFNGSYKYHRNRSKCYLSYETAKKSVDLVYTYFKDRNKKNIAISFYGGEPLLNYQNLKKIVEYSCSKFSDWKIHFSMTTNGTLLNGDILNFLIQNDFHLLVSLDGPKNVHDSQRIFLSGKGSYNDVMDNLAKIKIKHIKYYLNNIGFSAVWSPNIPINKICDFFSNNNIVKHNKVTLNREANSKPCENELVKRKQYNEKEYENGNLQTLSKITDKVKKHKKLTSIEYNLFINYVEENLKYRSSTSLYGCCFLNNRLYVDSKGDFHICHMINNKFPIGNAYTGFNFKRMEEIYKEYSMLNERHCRNCEVNFLCMRCLVTFAKKGRIQFDKYYCKIKKNQIIDNLERYVKDKKASISYVKL